MKSTPTGQADRTPGHAAPGRLGQYTLLSVIGTGSMGIVYKSCDPQRSCPVALKTIRRELLDDEIESFPARLRMEARVAGALTHPCIVGVYEYGEAEGYAYIAMEYVEGHSLRDCFESNVRFNIEQTINILAQLLEALQYAHDCGVWHRDVKPANILLMRNGQVKVTDFGIARVESVSLAPDSIMGTPGFIAPEAYLGEELDHRIDLFAAGAVLYHLLAGVPPFVGTPEKIMFKVCYESPLPVSVVARQASLRRFDAVVLKALARRPEDRFASATEFLEALQLARAGAPDSADETVIVPRRPAPNSDETALVSRRVRPAAPPSSDETRIVPRRSDPDDANLTILWTSPTDSPITEPLPPLQTLQPDADNVPPRQLPSGNTPAPVPGWDPQVLTRIEKQLARFMGPIAQVWVRGAARETSDFATLIQLLAVKISSLPNREGFLRAAGVELAPPARSDSNTEVPASCGAPLTPEYVARASRLLAVHLGPIATVLAKRAAQPSSSQEQFVATLAAHLSNDRDRARFLKALAS